MIEITREPSENGREVLTFTGVDISIFKSRSADRSSILTQKKARQSARLKVEEPVELAPSVKLKPKPAPPVVLTNPPIPITDAPFVVKELLHRAWLIFYNNYFLCFKDDYMTNEQKRIAESSSYALHTLHERLFVDSVHARPGKRDKWEISGLSKIHITPEEYDSFASDLAAILAAGDDKDSSSDKHIMVSKERISMTLAQLIAALVQTWDCYLNEDLATTVLWSYGESEFISLLKRHPGEYIKWELPEKIQSTEIESTRSQNAQRRRTNTPVTPTQPAKPPPAPEATNILAMDKSLAATDKAIFKLLDELFRGEVFDNKANMAYFSNFLNPALMIQETTDPYLSYPDRPRYFDRWRQETEEILEYLKTVTDDPSIISQAQELPDGENGSPDDFDEISHLLAAKQERLRELTFTNQIDRERVVRRVTEGIIDDRLLVALERDHLMRTVNKIVETWFISEGKIKDIEEPRTLASLAARAPGFLREIINTVKTHGTPDSAEIVIGIDLLKEIDEYLANHNNNELRDQILDFIARNPTSNGPSVGVEETHDSELKFEQ